MEHQEGLPQTRSKTPIDKKLPYIAVGLELATAVLLGLGLLLLFVASWLSWLAGFFVLLAVLSPIAGVVTAVVALCMGKARIEKKGVILSIIALALPLVLIPLCLGGLTLAIAAGM